jgi:hypothetical protein
MTRLRIEDCANDVCPWSGKPVAADALTRYRGQVVGFSEPALRDRFLMALLAFETAIGDPLSRRPELFTVPPVM